MSRYAEGTSVPVDRSRTEIERTLTRFGASAFMYGWQDDGAVVGFVAEDRQVRFVVPLPDPDDPDITHTPGMRARSAAQRQAAYEQAVRQRWRALLLIIKAKLEAVESGIVSFEQEFAVHTVLPSGQTVGEWLLPQIEQTYETGGMPRMLPAVRLAIEAGEPP